MTDSTNRRWLTPGVKGIGGASLLADLGHEIPTSLLPSLVTSTLGAPAAALGLIEGVADGVAGAARFAGGVLADDPRTPTGRRGRRIHRYRSAFIVDRTGDRGVAGSGPACGRLASPGDPGAGSQRPPRRNHRFGHLRPAYGFERMMGNLGAVGGPLLDPHVDPATVNTSGD